MAHISSSQFQSDESQALASYGDIHGKPVLGTLVVISDAFLGGFWRGRALEMALASLVGVLGWGLGAWFLTRSACRGFDACLDRPRIGAWRKVRQ